VTLTVPSESRTLPVRLDLIRPEVRYNAAQQIARRQPEDGAECLHAALFPSSTVYFVALEALPILRAVAA
jgi:hypothetical protein